MLTAFKKNDQIAVKAYAGDAMTLLAFDLLKTEARRDFVGFSIEFKNQTMADFKALNNRLSFEVPDPNLSQAERRKLKFKSTEAPFQKFRWIHVLNNLPTGQAAPFFGTYQYRITPRWFKNGTLAPANPLDSVTIDILVQPFAKAGIAVSFTRGFLVSQAYTARFGPNGNVRPKAANLIFDPQTTTNDAFGNPGKPEVVEGIAPYTYEDQYAWMGFNARKTIMQFIDEVLVDKTKKLDVLAYDFSEPDIASKLLELSKKGRIRMFLDDHDKANAANPGNKKSDPIFKQQFADQFDSSTGSSLTRHHFGRLGHSKILMQRDSNNKVIKVLTGSTNFTVNGIYINANHILVFTHPEALDLYGQMFEETIASGAKSKFKNGPLAQSILPINQQVSVGFSPHKTEIATQVLNVVNERIKTAQQSVFFAVMELKSTGSVTQSLREVHQRDDIFTLGITDLKSEKGDIKVRLYEPKSKKGVLVNGKKSPKILPPPFTNEVSLGLGHQVHHKFVVVDFNSPNAAVFCGSSNLAQGGEESNGDNLLMIQDPDVAAVFAIEAIRLIDHYQFRNRVDATSKGLALKKDGKWCERYFDPTDLYHSDRTLFIANL